MIIELLYKNTRDGFHDFNEAHKGLLAELDMLLTSYSSCSYHVLSVTYPLCHLLHCVQNCFRLLIGIISVVYALFNPGLYGSGITVLKSMGLETGALVCNAMHIVVSAFSLLSRTLSTLCHGGYANKDTPKSMFFASSLGFAEAATIGRVDQYIQDVSICLESGMKI